MERSYVMIKPDGVQRGLIGEVIGRLEKKGLKITGMKMFKVSEAQAKTHYGFLSDKPFFGELIRFITSEPVIGMVVEGKNCVFIIRKILGATKPQDAEAGTIRGDYALDAGQNIVHASDSVENAEKEITNFFKPEEIQAYTMAIASWIAPQ